MEGIDHKLFSQVMELWILPEIEKRKETNRLSSDFRLTRAQVIFSKDRNISKVRLNNQVKAIVKAKVNREVKKGEEIHEFDINEIKNIELTNKDPNVGHVTLLLFRNKWFISFDFRYNKKRVKDRLEAAKEFYDSSKENLENKRLRPFFENSFACAELLTEALLIQFFNKDTLKGHESRLNMITNWAKLENIDQKFSDSLHLLWKLRSSARYMSSTEFRYENPDDYLTSLKELYDFVEKSIS